MFCGCSAVLYYFYPPSPFPKKSMLALCPTAFCAPKALATYPGSQGENKQRLVCQANLETRRLGQQGRGPIRGLKGFSVPGFPFPCRGRGGLNRQTLGDVWDQAVTRLFLTLKPYRFQKGRQLIQCTVFIFPLDGFICTLIRNTTPRRWFISVCCPPFHNPKVSPSRLLFLAVSFSSRGFGILHEKC